MRCAPSPAKVRSKNSSSGVTLTFRVVLGLVLSFGHARTVARRRAAVGLRAASFGDDFRAIVNQA